MLTITTLTSILTENYPLIYNKLEQVVKIHLLQVTVKLLTGVEMILFKREHLLEVLTMVGQVLIIQIGLWAETIMRQLIRTQLLSVMELYHKELLIFIWKTNKLILEEMHGVKLTELMVLLTVLLMEITLDMELYKETLIHTLKMDKLLVFLTLEASKCNPL